MTRSNQYPRLPWERNPEPVHGGFIATLEGTEGTARIYFDRTEVRGDRAPFTSLNWWVWTVRWPERFGRYGMVYGETRDAGKQAAADAATTAFWDLMEETAGWKPAPPPPPPRIDLLAWHYWMRVDDWLWNRATLDEVRFHLGRYMKAATTGPAIIGQPEDKAMWLTMTSAYAKHLNFGFPPERPPGTRGYLAQLRIERGLSPQT